MIANEILENIIQRVTQPKDICSILQSCKHLREIAYCSISFILSHSKYITETKSSPVQNRSIPYEWILKFSNLKEIFSYIEISNPSQVEEIMKKCYNLKRLFLYIPNYNLNISNSIVNLSSNTSLCISTKWFTISLSKEIVSFSYQDEDQMQLCDLHQERFYSTLVTSCFRFPIYIDENDHICHMQNPKMRIEYKECIDRLIVFDYIRIIDYFSYRGGRISVRFSRYTRAYDRFFKYAKNPISLEKLEVPLYPSYSLISHLRYYLPNVKRIGLRHTSNMTEKYVKSIIKAGYEVSIFFASERFRNENRNFNYIETLNYK
jgi:hypothetical protein